MVDISDTRMMDLGTTPAKVSLPTSAFDVRLQEKSFGSNVQAELND